MGLIPGPSDAQQPNAGGTRTYGLLIRACVVYYVLLGIISQLSRSFSNSSIKKNPCHPPPLNLLAYHPPSANNKDILKAAQRLDQVLAKRVSKFNSGIDSLSIAVITPNGPIFERGYGVLRANESARSGQEPVDRDSIYRIASITKMFTVLETLILRERGALNWDDPIEKYLPEFSTPTYGWTEYLDGEFAQKEEQPHVTLRQVASHLGGIGRDIPPQDIGDWPTDIPWDLSQKADLVPTYSYESMMKAISQTPPLTPIPYTPTSA